MGKMFSQIIASFTSFLKTSKLVTREAALTEGGVSENQVDVNNVTQEGLEGLSEEEIVSIAKSLKGKLDVRLMAMAWVMFAFNHFDRSCLASAKIMGLQDDLGMNSGQYDLAMMLLFLGYFVAQVPSNLYIAKVRPSKYLPLVMVFWGITCMCTAFVKAPKDLYILRLILGILEAPFVVGCLFLISSWYTRTELGLRSAILFSAPLTAHAFTGIVAFAIGNSIDGALGRAGWSWLFIVGGASTIFVALLAFIVLPDYPHNTRWINEQQRAVAHRRLVADGRGVDCSVSRYMGFKLAAKDRGVWIFAAVYFLTVSGASLHNFFPSVVNTLGFSLNQTLWMTAPPYILTVVVAVPTALCADRYRVASWYIIVPTVIGIVGFLVFLLLQSSERHALWIRYTSTFFMLAGAHTAAPIVMGWVQKTIRQPKEKRACAIAMINSCGTMGQIVTSFMYHDEWEPRYIPSMSFNVACAVVAILLVVLMRWRLQRANKMLDQGQSEAAGTEMEDLETNASTGEQAGKGFRYIL